MSKPLSRESAAAFTRAVVTHFLGVRDAIGDDLTYEDFIDLAVKHDIVETVAFDPGIHGDCAGADECEEGDSIVVPTYDDRDE